MIHFDEVKGSWKIYVYAQPGFKRKERDDLNSSLNRWANGSSAGPALDQYTIAIIQE